MRPAEIIIFEVTEAPEGGFVARALGHSIFTVRMIPCIDGH